MAPLNNMASLAEMRSYRSFRFSSENEDFKSNQDYWLIFPGETSPILDVEGCGAVSDIWMTSPSKMCSGSWYEGSLEITRIRMYWDGMTEPAVDAPLGAFFCVPSIRHGNSSPSPSFLRHSMDAG